MRLTSLLILLSASSPALAQQTTPQVDAPKEEKPICRRIQVTGSNFSKRVCHTKAEWDAIHQADQENAARALAKRNPGAANSF